MPLEDESGHKWKKLLEEFDQAPEIQFKDVMNAVGGDIFLLPKKCFDYFIKNLPRGAEGREQWDMISEALLKKEHKSLVSKIDRALFNLNKSLKYADEEIKDFFINSERGGAKFIQAMKDVFAAIKKFFVETIPNFTERAWSQVRENVLIPAQKNIDLAVSHVNEAISKGFTPKYVPISGQVSEAHTANRGIIEKRAAAGIADEKLKRAMQGLGKEDRKIIKDIMKETRGSSSKSEYYRDETLNKAREHRDALRDAASNGNKVALQDIVQQIRESRETDSAVSSPTRDRRSSGRRIDGNFHD